MATKKDFLKEVIKHIEIKEHNVVKLVDSMECMAFTARDLNRAARIYETMLKDDNCAVILTLAGSLFSAGLKRVVFDLVNNNMVDAIVSTGAIMVDQDFFEALGFKHYIGSPFISIVSMILLLTKMNSAFATIQPQRFSILSIRVHILRASSSGISVST